VRTPADHRYATPGTLRCSVDSGPASTRGCGGASRSRFRGSAISAWDGLVRGVDWAYGAEAETHPTDGQALARRLELKKRDGAVDGVILILPATRHARLFLAAAGELLAPAFPVPGRRAIELLRAGVDPGGNSIVIV
jgi:hypothetical protein